MDADDASSAEMRRPHAHPDPDPLALDEETLERLLAGELPPAQAPPGYEKVAALLAAATAAPTPEELAGQPAALAELRAVTRPRRAATRTRRTARPPRRRWAGLAAVALVGALVTGGAAAATGHLPAPVRDVARSILGTVGGAEPATSDPLPGSSAQSPDAGRAGQPPPPTGATVGAPGTTGAATAASPNLKGLCRTYLAGTGAENAKKLDATAFQALARAAGGEDKIQAYCQRLQPPNPEPDDTKPKDPRPKDQEPGASDDPGQGQGGLPPSTGAGGQSQGQGNPQATGSPSR
jgi:hypothetical protein